MIYDYWYIIDEMTKVSGSGPGTADEVKCDACGEEINNSNAHLLIRTFKCHMNEKCITESYHKVKKSAENFELATGGAAGYGQAR